MSEFKVGDLVYFPKMTQKICVLSDGIPKYLTDRPLCIDGLTENDWVFPENILYWQEFPILPKSLLK